MQRWKQRSRLDLERAIGDLCNAPGDPKAVHRFQSEDLQDKDIERALQKSSGRGWHVRTDILYEDLHTRNKGGRRKGGHMSRENISYIS